ncbi:AraC family transcriptional regulator [Pseudomonas putida]|uniref:AraC family transcriptional regulator n=1 Tax=Pseudomonas putida TaxID=303 RepID=UPI001E4AE9B2|nr:helix-turn-helix transcriptional regulator [Pseudomonas putida]
MQVQEIRYQPEGCYPYGLEVLRVSELRRRTSRAGMRRTYGYTFYMLVLVTEGQCVQYLDFEPCSGMEGSVLVVRPGQTHSFGEDEAWDGWIMLVRPEFLWPTSFCENPQFEIERLPAFMQIDAERLERAKTSVKWMNEDATHHDKRGGLSQAKSDGPQLAEWSRDVQTHLRLSFYALVSWLVLTYSREDTDDPRKRSALKRHYQFKGLVEKYFVKCKSIRFYAAEMGCTERSLTRAVQDVEGISAKQFVSNRRALEAKRLLIHTDLPVGVIAERLGFKEATHFSKFFRRVAGSTPQQFRISHSQG